MIIIPHYIRSHNVNFALFTIFTLFFVFNVHKNWKSIIDDGERSFHLICYACLWCMLYCYMLYVYKAAGVFNFIIITLSIYDSKRESHTNIEREKKGLLGTRQLMLSIFASSVTKWKVLLDRVYVCVCAPFGAWCFWIDDDLFCL